MPLNMNFQFFLSTDPIGNYFRLKMHKCPLDVLEFLDMVFVNAAKQSNLLVNCNNSIPFFLLYRRPPFLTPFCLEKQAILGYEALTFLSIRPLASLPSFDSTTSRGQIRCLLSLLTRKRTMSLYSFTSIRYGGQDTNERFIKGG